MINKGIQKRFKRASPAAEQTTEQNTKQLEHNPEQNKFIDIHKCLPTIPPQKGIRSHHWTKQLVDPPTRSLNTNIWALSGNTFKNERSSLPSYLARTNHRTPNIADLAPKQFEHNPEQNICISLHKYLSKQGTRTQHGTKQWEDPSARTLNTHLRALNANTFKNERRSFPNAFKLPNKTPNAEHRFPNTEQRSRPALYIRVSRLH